MRGPGGSGPVGERGELRPLRAASSPGHWLTAGTGRDSPARAGLGACFPGPGCSRRAPSPSAPFPGGSNLPPRWPPARALLFQRGVWLLSRRVSFPRAAPPPPPARLEVGRRARPALALPGALPLPGPLALRPLPVWVPARCRCPLISAGWGCRQFRKNLGNRRDVKGGGAWVKLCARRRCREQPRGTAQCGFPAVVAGSACCACPC